jgi:hypothetical protein
MGCLRRQSQSLQLTILACRVKLLVSKVLEKEEPGSVLVDSTRIGNQRIQAANKRKR